MSYVTITGKDKYTGASKPVKTLNNALIMIDEKEALPIGESYVNLTQGASIYADTLPIPTADTMGRRGWYYTNSAGPTQAMNFYYMNGASENLTVENIKGQYAILTMDDVSTYNSACMLAYYTKPTPADITAGLWYHTRITYGMEPGTGAQIFKQHLAPGERVMVYWGVIDTSLEPTIRRIPLIKLSQIGPNEATEELLTMTINSQQQAAAGKVKNLVESAGFEAQKGSLGNEFNQIVRRLTFTTSSATGGGITQVQSNSQNLATESTVIAMSSKLDTGIPIKGLDLTTSSSQPIVMSSGNLHVKDLTLSSQLTSLNNQLVSQWSVQNNGSFQLLETVPAISGGVRLAGDTTGNAFVVVKNSSLDTHIMGSHDGSAWHHILTTPQGKIIVNSSTQDGNGELITSTIGGTGVRGLDVNVINSSVNSLIRANDAITGVPVTLTASSGALKINTAGQTIACNTQDGSGALITSTSSGTVRGLDVNVMNTAVNSLIRANDSTTGVPVTLQAVGSALSVSTLGQTIAIKAQPVSLVTLANSVFVSSTGAFGSVGDTEGYLYLGIALTVTGFSGSGHSVYAQIGFDGVNFTNSQSTYVSGNGTYFITFYQPSAFRYIRLYADMSFISGPTSYTCTGTLSQR